MAPWAPLLFIAAAPTVAMNGHLPSTADLDGMSALGVSAVRVDFNWYDFEPAAGSFAFGPFDGVVQGANARGIAVYATVAYTPQWASSVASCTPGSTDPVARCENKLPANGSDWTAAVTAVVTRYRGQVACWGIWNEPNLGLFFSGTVDDFANQIFLPAAAAIRAADPAARICGPELSGLTASSTWNGNNCTCAFGGCIRNGWELDLGQMLDRVGGQLDVITQHMYKPDAPGIVVAMVEGEYFGTLLTHDSVRHVIDSHGGAGKPVWLTESGWEHAPQGPYAVTDVATRLTDLFAKQEEVCAGTYAATDPAWPAWERTFYYHYPYDPGSGWGIVDANGPLAPYTALQAWTSGRTTSACGPAAVAPDAGNTVDAGGGTSADAGAPPDAGTPMTDAGAGPLSDAGARNPGVDAGAQPVAHAGDAASAPRGCGCAGQPGASTLAFVLLAAALARARRR